MTIPKKYDPQEAEKKWAKHWEKEKTYQFDQKSKAEIYSIDTPPPTVSGKVHIGHAFSYSQQDFIIRFQRMLGKNVFYPFGTDNNGVATERLVEQTRKIKARDMPREEFAKICLEELEKNLIPRYKQGMKRLGLSCDYDIFYTTIDPHCQKISQRSFIELYQMGREYRKDAPAMWCPECETGISQQECVDQEIKSTFNDIIFKVDGKDLVIATTRPELLPACVAVFYHPEDKRYQKLKGKPAKVPLFDIEVPIMPDERADPEKGTGIVMCCTFGDQTDMEWQKAHNLEIKEAITKDGKMTKLAGKYKGMYIKDARKAITEDMKKQGLLVSQKPITHAVNVHERCGTEIEIIKSKQWFIKYLDLKKDMIKWGEKLNWYPQHFVSRYKNWAEGLQWDWLISRQRYFGVPFPVWYCKACDEPILAEEKDLPVDPLKDNPPVKKCLKCGVAEFVSEKDVLDTWATSSLTPRLAVELMPKEIQKRLYPMNLRPQAHDIITFWLFNTVVKSNLHYKVNPFKDVMVSGWLLDPKGKKMSKSKGNVIEPTDVIEKYSADALRFMAAGTKLGEDLPYQEKDVVTGMKTITKLWNASKFSFMHLEDYKKAKPKKIELFDKWILSKLNRIIKSSTEAFMKYEYSRTRLDVEKFFWQTLCDNYLEIVKDRMYNPDKRGKQARESAQYALYNALLSTIKLLAPIMPFITEEIYQDFFKKTEKDKSIHISKWPEFDKKIVDDKIEEAGDAMIEIIGAVRREKTKNKKSLGAEMAKLVIECDNKLQKSIEAALEDLKAVTKAQTIEFGKGDIETGTEIKVKIVF
ncbi:valine--tRNA ligase [Candidatus Woesearchaeota archaeon]|nr:valine--tRNA ligase [Candidatus Woesearchaeota archaeon]